jgi:hypothetical protein
MSKKKSKILSTPQEVNASLRKSHQHAGKTVLVIATEKSDLAKIENVSGASKISLFLNLIGEGGGGLTKIRHESKNFREDWALI